MIIKEKFTISSLLLLPLFLHKDITLNSLTNGLNLELVRSKISFVNAYTFDKNDPNGSNQLHLLFNFKVDNHYVKLINQFKILDYYKGDKYYVIDDKKYLKYTFDDNGEFTDDITRIKNGEFSLISEDSKSIILGYWGSYPNIIKQILNITKNDSSELVEEIDENTYNPVSHLGENVYAVGL